MVSEHANAYQLSFEAAKCINTNSADTFADGLAVRNPSQQALDVLRSGLKRIVDVSDEMIMAAISHYFNDTHNVAEGAGAASLAALLMEKNINQGKKTGVVLTGGNITQEIFRQALLIE